MDMVKRMLKKYTSHVLIVVGILLVGFSGVHLYKVKSSPMQGTLMRNGERVDVMLADGSLVPVTHNYLHLFGESSGDATVHLSSDGAVYDVNPTIIHGAKLVGGLALVGLVWSKSGSVMEMFSGYTGDAAFFY
jgi:hypothetical protein